MVRYARSRVTNTDDRGIMNNLPPDKAIYAPYPSNLGSFSFLRLCQYLAAFHISPSQPPEYF